MLWADDESCLPINYFSAVVQLKSLERRLQKDADLKASYAKTISDYFSEGYVVQVEKIDCFKVDQPRECYLPHHPVVHPHKPGKVRTVINGAAKFHGQSLNNALLTGPDLLKSLIHTLFRFLMLYMRTSNECFYKLELSHVTDHHLVFFNGRTQQLKLLFSSMLGIFSAPKIRLHALTTPWNKLPQITKPTSQMQHEEFTTTFV